MGGRGNSRPGFHEARRVVRGTINRYVAEALEARRLLSTVAWTGAAGDNQWTTPGNWSTGALPGPNDDVTINVGGNSAIHLTSGVQSIHSLVTTNGVFISGGELDVATTVTFSAPFEVNFSGTLRGGIYTEQANAGMAMYGQVTLDGLTLNTSLSIGALNLKSEVDVVHGLTLENNAPVFLFGSDTSLVFDGTQTLGGTGQIVYEGGELDVGDGAPGSGPAAVTIGSGIVVHGQTGTPQTLDVFSLGSSSDQFINQGTFAADNPNDQIDILANFTNDKSGLIKATASGSFVSIDSSSFMNAGTVQDGGGGRVGIGNVSGTFVVASFTGGTALLDGIVNAGNLNVSGGSVTLNANSDVIDGISVSGGTVAGSASIEIVSSGNMTGGSLLGSGPITVDQSAFVQVRTAFPVITRPFSNAGNLDVASGATLELDGGGTQSGTYSVESKGTLTFGGSAANMFPLNSSVTGAGSVDFVAADQATIGGSYTVGATQLADQASVELDNGGTTGQLSVGGGASLVVGQPGTFGSVLNVINQSVFSGGITTVMPENELDSAAGLIFTGGNPVIDLVAADFAPGKLVLGGDVSSTGASGSASILSTGAGADPGTFDLGNAARAFSVNRADTPDDLRVGAQIINGAIVKNGAGVLQLISPDTYAGGTTAAAGTIEVDDPAALGAGPFTFAGGTLARRTPGGQAPANPIDVGPADTVSLDVGPNAVQLASPQLGSTLVVTGAAGGALTLTGSMALRHDLIINNDVPVLVEGTIGGNFGLTKTGSDNLTFFNSAPDTWTGPTEVAEGILLLHDSGGAALPGDVRIDGPASIVLRLPNQLPATASVTFDDTLGVATLGVNGQSQSLATLHSFQSGAGLVLLGGGTLDAADTSDFSGAILRGRSAANVAGAGATDGSTSAAQVQRSEVRQAVLTFDQSIPALPASAFSLVLLNTGGSGKNDNSAPTPIPLSSVLASLASPDGGLTWVMTFKPNTAFTDSTGSLLDGVYTLSVNSPAIVGGAYASTFHRLFGDLNGDKQVSNTDYFQFRKAFNTNTGQSAYNADLDFNGDGTISNTDYFQFRKRFLKAFTY